VHERSASCKCGGVDIGYDVVPIFGRNRRAAVVADSYCCDGGYLGYSINIETVCARLMSS
jgi:hypothetical protein